MTEYEPLPSPLGLNGDVVVVPVGVVKLVGESRKGPLLPLCDQLAAPVYDGALLKLERLVAEGLRVGTLDPNEI